MSHAKKGVKMEDNFSIEFISKIFSKQLMCLPTGNIDIKRGDKHEERRYLLARA